MDTGIKNGKHYANNIYTFKMVFMLLTTFIVISGFAGIDLQEKKWIIVIDPGHGGKDPGALGSMSKEKDINLAIALKTGEYLEKNMKNIKVLYTRKSDIFVGLKERADFANKNKADLFISIHTNAIAKKNIKGTETWIMGTAKDDQNLEVAMKENEVMLLEDDFSTKYEGFDPTSTESYIIFTLMQYTFQEQSTLLASNVQSQFKNRAGRIDLGVKQAGFWVLYMTTMPSVLIETGFLTNAEEEKYLVSKEGQEYISSAIFRACRDYINDIEKKNAVTAKRESLPEIKQDNSVIPKVETDQVSFMIQIAASVTKKELKPENFKGIKEVVELAIQDRFKYATGNFYDYYEAVSYRKRIETIFPDAFVIAVRDNKILPLQEALEMKKNKTQ